MQTFSAKVVADATIQQIDGGSTVVHFTLVDIYQYITSDGTKKEKKNFFHCSYWRNPGVQRYITKGTVLSVHGYIYATVYEKKNKEVAAQLNFHVDELSFLGGSKPATPPSENSNKETANAEPVSNSQEAPDDLPF